MTARRSGRPFGRRCLRIPLWVGVAIALAAGSAVASTFPVYGGEIRLPREAGPVDLDPLRAVTPLSRTLVHVLFDTLFRLGPDGRPVPHLALSHEMFEDGLVFRIWLRPNPVFHDGTALTARDVKASLERILAPASQAWWLLATVDGAEAFHHGQAAEVTGIVVKGNAELEIRLARAMPLLPLALCSPRASIARVSAGSGAVAGAAGGSALSLVGTGPFRFRRIDEDGAVVLEAFEEHFAGGPYFDRARFVPLQGTKEQALSLEIGRLDCAYVEGGADGRPRKGYGYLPIDDGTLFVAIRERGTFQTPAVRAALNFAVDRGAIVDVLLRGEGEAALGLLPPALAPFSFVRRCFPYDLAEARSLRGTVERLRAKMLVPAGSPLGRRIGERLQVNLLDLGVEISLVEAPPLELGTRLLAGEADLALGGWSAESPDSALSLASMIAEWGGSEDLFTRVRPALERAMSAPAATQAVRSLFVAETEALEQVPWILLAHPRDGYSISPAIGGLQADFGGILRVEDAWRKPSAAEE